MTGESDAGDLNGDQRHHRRHDDHQIPLFGHQLQEDGEAALDVEGVVGSAVEAAGGAETRGTAEVGKGLDGPAFVAVEKGGIVRFIDDDAGRRGNAAAVRHQSDGVDDILFAWTMRTLVDKKRSRSLSFPTQIRISLHLIKSCNHVIMKSCHHVIMKSCHHVIVSSLEVAN